MNKQFKMQLLKWVGNKQKFAQEIISHFPTDFNRYFEPFLGGGAVLATLSPQNGIGSDNCKPLIEIWQTLKKEPGILKKWYSERYEIFHKGDKKKEYIKIRNSYNENPNGADLLFLCRSCYGGIIRFRKSDNYMSTPVGSHNPINPQAFSKRVDEWHKRTFNTNFFVLDYEEAMDTAKEKDLIYCDPPYKCSQTILYGAQKFCIDRLFDTIKKCKSRGVYVVLSLDGTKKSGTLCNIEIPNGLFEQEVFIKCGKSMLKRFQLNGQITVGEDVEDRLLLTY